MSLSPEVSAADYVRGDLNAPVVLVQYGDFECPYSGAAYGAIQDLQAQWKERLCYVFRPFPLADIHPHAQLAAQAAVAAGDQFWAMHDILFENQEYLSERDLLGYAQELGLDLAHFKSNLHADATQGRVQESVRSGRVSGAHGTPTFFVNGQFHDNREGLWEKEALRSVLQRALD